MADFNTFKMSLGDTDKRIEHLVRFVRPGMLLKPLLWEVGDWGGISPVFQTDRARLTGSVVTRDQLRDYFANNGVTVVDNIPRIRNSVGGNRYEHYGV